MPGSIHSQEPLENDQSMVDAEPEVTDPILLDEKRIVVVRTSTLHFNAKPKTQTKTNIII
jgi:hypothetical protein